MDFKRKKIFFTSDWHIGHANVIKFDDRPFQDLDHMHKILVDNYNACVDEDSVCYFLGDVGFCKGDTVSKIINQLAGVKILILGNHDKNVYSMYAQGFDVVMNAGVIYIGDKRISMSHCPLPGVFREDVTNMKGAKEGENWHGERKNGMFTSQDLTVDFHLHGHCHSDGVIKPRTLLNQFDVGVRCNKYRPVRISEIESWIAHTQKSKET